MQGKKTVLIVDDLEDNRLAIKMALRQREYDIVEAEHGLAALNEMERSKPDLVIMDILMPVMDGYEATRRIKQDPQFCLTPIIMVTALGGKEDKIKGLEVGADDFITKPFDRIELRARVHNLLRMRSLALRTMGAEKIALALINLVEFKNIYSKGHATRVHYYSHLLSERIGLTEDEMIYTRVGALLHDIGKIAVSENIFYKETYLNEQEWKEIKKHPQMGYNILKPFNIEKPILDIVSQHHEKLNGMGYPLGLTKEEINISSQIVALADIFDALTNNRPYRPAYNKKEALKIIKEEAKEGFLCKALAKDLTAITKNIDLDRINLEAKAFLDQQMLLL